ncbi:MAG: tetratricopeptide repeat protein [Ignavibacteria bacterium]|nr:tetratricopeptide repeat protein [Ignavibacteria bacterium]
MNLALIVTILPLSYGIVIGQGARTPSDSARQHFINGTSLQIQGNRHAEAILEFQESLEYDSSAICLTAMARSYLELRRLNQAEEHVEHALRIDPRLRDAWEVLSEVMIASGRYDEGIKAYEHILDLEPTNRQLYTLGRLYEPRDARKAISVFKRLAASEQSSSLHLRIADLYKRIRDKDGWLEEIRKAHSLDEDNAEAATAAIQAYTEFGMLPDARAIAYRWLQLYPRSESTLKVWSTFLQSLLADSLLANLFDDDVSAVLKECEHSFAWNGFISMLSGAVALEVKDTRTAGTLFDAAANKVSSNPDYLLQIAMLYRSNDYFLEAIDFLKKWKPTSYKDPRFNLLTAECLIRLEREDAAEDEYRIALAIDSTLIEAWLQIALIHDNRQDFPTAIVSYERALLLDPDNSLANNNYAYSIAVRGGDMQRARDMAWRAVRQYPTNPAYLDTYAWVLYRDGETEKALIYIRKAVESGGSATHYEHLGDILETNGDIDGAVRAWETALARDPERVYLRARIDRYR